MTRESLFERYMQKSVVPVETMKELSLLSWASLIVGLIHGWATQKDIVDFAVDQLMREAYGPNNTALLAGGETLRQDEVLDLVRKIMKELNSAVSSEEAVELKQWRLAHLITATRQGYPPEELLDHVAEIYAEFGFPQDMWLTSRYNLTPEDREHLKTSKPAHDPLAALDDVIESLRRKLVTGASRSF